MAVTSTGPVPGGLFTPWRGSWRSRGVRSPGFKPKGPRSIRGLRVREVTGR
jgi:hypothetical protein